MTHFEYMAKVACITEVPKDIALDYCLAHCIGLTEERFNQYWEEEEKEIRTGKKKRIFKG